MEDRNYSELNTSNSYASYNLQNSNFFQKNKRNQFIYIKLIIETKVIIMKIGKAKSDSDNATKFTVSHYNHRPRELFKVSIFLFIIPIITKVSQFSLYTIHTYGTFHIQLIAGLIRIWT